MNGIQIKNSLSRRHEEEKKNIETKRRTYMMKIKWTLQWLFISIILGLINLQKINANEAISYIPALECNDPYGKPQVNIKSFTFIPNKCIHLSINLWCKQNRFRYCNLARMFEKFIRFRLSCMVNHVSEKFHNEECNFNDFRTYFTED